MIPSLSELVAQRKPIYAGWCTLGSSLGVELVAAAGWELALIDQQHGFGGQSEMLAGLTAARAGRIPACVRIAWNEPALVGRALDAGAHGIVCQMINTADDAGSFVAAAKYPPIGARSWGPYRSQLLLDDDHLTSANGWTKTFAQIETAEALANLDDILAVDGLDGILVGPNDLAISMTGDRDIGDKAVLAAIGDIRIRSAAAGKITWIFANDSTFARPVIEAGWQIVTIGTDAGWLSAGAAQALR